MAACTSLVPAVARDATGFLRVAPATQFEIAFGERERVWLVALGAAHASVKRRVSVCGLVAAAAGFCAGMGVGRARGRTARMRVMTADTARARADFGMVRMHASVAIRAGFFRAAAHVVRPVAAGALIVSSDARCTEHVDLSVAGATRLCSLFAEVVRPVATDAFAVAVGEERGLGHDRLLGRVARLAGTDGFGGWRVLVLVAGGANLHRRFADRGVVRGYLPMAIHARPGPGRGVLVRLVAAYAVARAVHDDGGGLALLLRVAACAVFRREFRVGSPPFDCLCRKLGGGERVAAGAVGFGVVAEALLRLALSVVDSPLLLVTSAAARGRSRAHPLRRKLVALHALDALLDDVHLMAAHFARGLPRQLDVDALTGAALVCVGARASQHDCDDDRSRKQRQATRLSHPDAVEPTCFG